MIGISIFGIEISDLLLYFFAGIGLLTFVNTAYQCFKANNYDFFKKLKQYIIYMTVIVILLLLFIVPFFLWEHGLFNDGSFLYNSDILGYYGAIIGGVVTVLGIYWTFYYERMISLEKRKEESLPLLKFSLKSEKADNQFGIKLEGEPENDKQFDLRVVRGIEILKEFLQLRYKRDKATLEGNDKEIIEIEKSKSKILFSRSFCFLSIKNIGLRTAILSSIQLVSHEDISSRVIVQYKKGDFSNYYTDVLAMDELAKDDITRIEMFAIGKNEEICLKIDFGFFDYRSNVSERVDDNRVYGRGDYFLIEFTDIYLNRYSYKLPIELDGSFDDYLVIMNQKSIPTLPEKINIP